MKRAVVIRAVRHHDRQAVGIHPGAGEVIARGLAGAIRRVRVIRGRLVEGRVRRADGAEDFVGRNEQEAKLVLGRAFKGTPVSEGRLKELEGSGDVGGDELARAVDRAVDVGFGGQVHDRLWLGGGEGPAHGLGIADIGLDEGEARLALQIGEGGQITRVGELIDDRDGMSARDQKSGQIRPDEARAAGDQDSHKQWWVKSGNTGGEARKKADPEGAKVQIGAKLLCKSAKV